MDPTPKKYPFGVIHNPKSNFPDLFGVENRGLQFLICLVYPVHIPNGRKGEGQKTLRIRKQIVGLLVYQNIQNVFLK